MSRRQRGQEVNAGISVDGEDQIGSWLKITDLTITPRTELVEDDFLGEAETDIDQQHNGYDIKFSAHNQDARFLGFEVELAARERDHQAPQRVNITLLNYYREPGEDPVNLICHNVILKMDDHGFGGRKDRTKTTFSGKFKRMDLLPAG